MENNIDYAALSVNDIIFIGRNKDYGAYELRESYNRRIKQSIFGALFFTAMLCSYQVIYTLRHAPPALAAAHVVAQLTEVTTPREAVQPPPAHTDPPHAKPQGTPDPAPVTQAILVPARADHAADSLPAQEQPAQTVVSDHTAGTDAGTSPGTESGDIAIAVHAPAAPAVSEAHDWVEVMPEYPGGEAAMMRFLADNIQYPQLDREMGNHGRVVVGFIIDETGKVTNITILKGLTRTLNQESIRVVSRLSTFKPGMQGGHNVKVRYTLPINYQLRDE